MTDDRLVVPMAAPIPTARAVVEAVNASHGQQLWGFARRLGLDDDEARDATQEALLRLWRVSSEGHVPDNAVAWTFRTLYRLAMDRHRGARRWLGFLDRQRLTDAQPVHDSDELVAVWSEVDRLPERQRHVLYLRYRADLTFADIGRVLGIDAGSARGNASRGIATLRARLGGGDE